MKKIFIYIILFFIIIFLLPLLCTKHKKIEVNSSEIVKEETNENNKYNYSKYANIKLYHSKTGENEEIPLDTYLYGVVSSEMPASFEMEALKAQAIVARTYTIYQIQNSKSKHGDCDICDNSACCQAWLSKEERLAKWDEDVKISNWNKIVEAVDSTSRKIITYEGAPIDAFFHSNSGGKTEVPSNVWGGSGFPYLQAVETSGEEGYSQYSSTVELSKEELINKLKNKYPNININYNEEECIKIIEYTQSNRVKTIKFGNIQIAGTEARSLLGLKSTNFSFEINGELVKFMVIGYGHGVGMSQTGADSMAKTGCLAQDIIKHFYSGVEIEELN